MEKEVWKEIPGFEGKYMASNYGRIKSIIHKEHILKQLKTKDGYMSLKLVRKDFSVKRFGVHRLVAMAFLDNPNNFPMVNHKDEDKTNNCVSNLEWCDAKYNINYGTGIKRRAIQVQRKVEMLDKNTNEVIRMFDSVGEASDFVGVTIACISNTCSNYDGHHKTCRGYKWRYAD